MDMYDCLTRCDGRVKPFAVLAVLLFLFFGSASAVTADPGRAPGFNLEDQNGETISLEDFEGSWVHLDFSADWCYWCHFQAEYMIEAEELLEAAGVDDFVSITLLSQDEQGGPPSESLLQKWADDYELEYVLGDPNGTVTSQYPVKGYPTNVILNPDLEILQYWSGSYRSAEDFIQALRSMAPDMFN